MYEIFKTPIFPVFLEVFQNFMFHCVYFCLQIFFMDNCSLVLYYRLIHYGQRKGHLLFGGLRMPFPLPPSLGNSTPLGIVTVCVYHNSLPLLLLT